MASVNQIKTPAHLWVVGIVSLLWNAFGAYDYTMTELGNRAYLEGMGFGAEEIAYFASFPTWLVAVWAIGVWGSLAGAILLLLRSRYAAPLFAASFAGALISFIYQFTADKPASLAGGLPLIMPIVIMILIAAQYWYARRMAAAGVLH